MKNNRMTKRITTETISVRALVEAGAGEHPECGGLCTFEGIVRNHHGGKSVNHLVYETYEPMAEKELQKLIDEIVSEWTDVKIQVLHRHGRLSIGDVAVAIAAWAPHRREAFRACEAMIERIKKRLPMWKHEFYGDGTDKWVMCLHD